MQRALKTQTVWKKIEEYVEAYHTFMDKDFTMNAKFKG